MSFGCCLWIPQSCALQCGQSLVIFLGSTYFAHSGSLVLLCVSMVTIANVDFHAVIIFMTYKNFYMIIVAMTNGMPVKYKCLVWSKLCFYHFLQIYNYVMMHYGVLVSEVDSRSKAHCTIKEALVNPVILLIHFFQVQCFTIMCLDAIIYRMNVLHNVYYLPGLQIVVEVMALALQHFL